jgi:hypothetical protein
VIHPSDISGAGMSEGGRISQIDGAWPSLVQANSPGGGGGGGGGGGIVIGIEVLVLVVEDVVLVLVLVVVLVVVVLLVLGATVLVVVGVVVVGAGGGLGAETGVVVPGANIVASTGEPVDESHPVPTRVRVINGSTRRLLVGPISNTRRTP